MQEKIILPDQSDILAENEALRGELANMKRERDAAIAKSALRELETKSGAAQPRQPQAPPVKPFAPAGVGRAGSADLAPRPQAPAPAPSATPAASAPKPPAPALPPGQLTAEILALALEELDRRREAQRNQDRSDRLRERFTSAHAKRPLVESNHERRGLAASAARLPAPVQAPRLPRASRHDS